MIMLKYFKNLDGREVEISSEDYVDELIVDARNYGETKSSALRIVRENRDIARIDGMCEWKLHFCGSLIIRSEVK